MPLKKGEVSKIKEGTEKEIYIFLKSRRSEVFSIEELKMVLEDKGLILAKTGFGKRIVVKTILENLVLKEKVKRYKHQDEDYFGIK